MKKSPVGNHVFTCAICRRQWTVVTEAKLDCFFLGVCCDCIQEHKMPESTIRRALNACVTLVQRVRLNHFVCPVCKRTGILHESPNEHHPNTILIYCRWTDCTGFSVEGETFNKAFEALEKKINA